MWIILQLFCCGITVLFFSSVFNLVCILFMGSLFSAMIFSFFIKFLTFYSQSSLFKITMELPLCTSTFEVIIFILIWRDFTWDRLFLLGSVIDMFCIMCLIVSFTKLFGSCCRTTSMLLIRISVWFFMLQFGFNSGTFSKSWVSCVENFASDKLMNL